MRRMTLVLAAAIAAGCDARPEFDAAVVARTTIGLGLPLTFLLGTASAAHQIEGGNDNDWTATWEPAHIRNGDVSGRAANSWVQWPEDVRAMTELGANTYRFSLEWSRLVRGRGEPWDAAAAANYRSLLLRLKAEGITPMVTLHHFTLPRWVADEGGWEWPGIADALGSFAREAAQRYGDLVDLWCTVNEPNVAAYHSYLQGAWPPGFTDTKRMVGVMVQMMRAHAAAARELRAADLTDADNDLRPALVGIAHHVQVFEPASWSSTDTAVAGLTDEFFNDAIPESAKTGRVHLYVPGEIEVDEPVEGLADSFDYLGINFYERNFLRFDITDPALSRTYVPADRPTNDLGWDQYAEGLYRLLVRFGRWGWPIYVTENGIADQQGFARPDYLRRHVYAVEQAIQAGVNVRGYFHWSLIDNFEWAEGYHGKFGLFSIDFSDPALTRRPTAAVRTFCSISRAMGRRCTGG